MIRSLAKAVSVVLVAAAASPWGPADAQEVAHLGELCFTAIDVLPPPADPANPVHELRTIRVDVLRYGSTTYALHGTVTDITRSRTFTVTGTARPADTGGAVTGTLTGAGDNLADYRGTFLADPSFASAGLFNDTQTVVPFGTDQMVMGGGVCTD